MKVLPVLIISILTAYQVHAQFEAEPSVENYTHIIQASPTASLLGKFGEYGVGGASGIPSITIPLTSISCNTIEIPVSLSYMGGGIKVNDISSWVGAGWSLNAGGAITRTINGIPDNMPYSLKELYDLGYDPDNSLVGPTSWYLATHVNRSFDGEADIFSFNFLSFSGSFYFAPDNEGNYVPHLIEHSDLRIEYDEGGDHFVIWDTQGTKYVFEETEFSSSTTSIAGNPLNQGVTAWYITKIDSKYESIDFIYEQGTTVSYQVGQTVTQKVALHNSKASFFSDGEPSEPELLIEKKYLKEIRASNGESISFFRTDRTDLVGFEKLDYFTHHTGNPHFVTYDLISSNTNKRLYLDKVSIESEGTETHGYSFDYIDRNALAERFGGQDLWGFNNGGDYSNPSIASHGIEGGHRSIDTNLTGAGTLRKITYPTGGSTEFVWENNKKDAQKTIFQAVDYELSFNESDWDASGSVTKNFILKNAVRINLRYDIETYQAAPHEPVLNGSIQFNLIKDEDIIFRELQTGSASNLDLGKLKPGLYSVELINGLGPTDVFEFNTEISWSEPTGTVQTIPFTQLIGGLRIKNIVSRNAQGDELYRKTFIYSNPSAYDNVKPTDFVNQVAAYEIQNPGTLVCSPVKTHYAYQYSNNRLDGGSALDYPAVYSAITEYHGTEEVNNGKIIRTFNPPDPGAGSSNPYAVWVQVIE